MSGTELDHPSDLLNASLVGQGFDFKIYPLSIFTVSLPLIEHLLKAAV